MLNKLIIHSLMPVGKTLAVMFTSGRKVADDLAIKDLHNWWKAYKIKPSEIFTTIHRALVFSLYSLEAAMRDEVAEIIVSRHSNENHTKSYSPQAAAIRSTYLRTYFNENEYTDKQRDDFLKDSLFSLLKIIPRTPTLHKHFQGDELTLLNSIKTAGGFSIAKQHTFRSEVRLAIAQNLRGLTEGFSPNLFNFLRDSDYITSAVEYFIQQIARYNLRIYPIFIFRESQTGVEADAKVLHAFNDFKTYISDGEYENIIPLVKKTEATILVVRDMRKIQSEINERIYPFLEDFVGEPQQNMIEVRSRLNFIYKDLMKINTSWRSFLVRIAEITTKLSGEVTVEEIADPLTQVYYEAFEFFKVMKTYFKEDLTNGKIYANCQLAEQRGDIPKALEYYELLLRQGVQAVDIALMFKENNEFAEGYKWTQTRLSALSAEYPDNPAILLVAAMMELHRIPRFEKLKNIIAKFPEFAPAYAVALDTLYSPEITPGAVELDFGDAYLLKFAELEAKGMLNQHFINKAMISKFLVSRHNWDGWRHRWPHLTLENILREDFQETENKGKTEIAVELALDPTIKKIEYRFGPGEDWRNINLIEAEHEDADLIEQQFSKSKYGLISSTESAIFVESKTGKAAWPATAPVELRFITHEGFASRAISWKDREKRRDSREAMMLIIDGTVVYLHPKYGLGTVVNLGGKPYKIWHEDDENQEVIMQFFAQPLIENDQPDEILVGASGLIESARRINVFDLLPGAIDLIRGTYTPVNIGYLGNLKDRERFVLTEILENSDHEPITHSTALKVIARQGDAFYLPYVTQFINSDNMMIFDSALYTMSCMLLRQDLPDSVRRLCYHLENTDDINTKKGILKKLENSLDESIILPLLNLGSEFKDFTANRLLDFNWETIRDAMLSQYIYADDKKHFLQRAMEIAKSRGDEEATAAQVILLFIYAEQIADSIDSEKIYDLLRNLTGKEFGNDIVEWRSWWLEETLKLRNITDEEPEQVHEVQIHIEPEKAPEIEEKSGEVEKAVDVDELPADDEAPKLKSEAEEAEFAKFVEEFRRTEDKKKKAGSPISMEMAAFKIDNEQAEDEILETEIECPGCTKKYMIRKSPKELRGLQFTCKKCNTLIKCSQFIK